MHIAGAEWEDIPGFWTFQGHFHRRKPEFVMCAGDHLRLTGFLPPAAEAQNGRNHFLFSTSLPKLPVSHTLPVLQISIRRLPCYLVFCVLTLNGAEETLLQTTQSLTAHSAFPWMRPTCLVPCTAPGSCTAVFSTFHIQQLDFLV